MGLLSAAAEGVAAPPPTRLFWYNAAAVIAVALVGPLAAVGSLFRPAWRRRLRDRLGIGWPVSAPVPILWAHAASVGEIEGIGPLVQRWHAEHPDGRVVVSALTATGCDVASTILPFAEVRAFPFDLPGIAERVARRLGPDLFLFSENEIWPNLLTALAERHVPTVQVSGRLSSRAAETLARFRSLTAGVLGRVTLFCVQSQDDRDRLLGLGVEADRVVVTGSLKGDGRLAPRPRFLAELEATGRPLVVVGSTHEGEEAIAISAIRLLGERAERPYWILAPRHPERFDGVAALLDEAGLRSVRRTTLDEGEGGTAVLRESDVLLLDTIGELAGCFPPATVCFIGGSLVPIGGHNLLEPARCGIPIIVGPHVETVRELADRLVSVGAATIVRDAAELAHAVDVSLADRQSEEAGAAARAVAEERAGSLARTWRHVSEAARLS